MRVLGRNHHSSSIMETSGMCEMPMNQTDIIDCDKIL